jgi:phosphatidate cytidylyltransferase
MTEILQFTLPLFALGAVGFAWANRRVSRSVARARWLKFTTYFLIVHAVVAAALAGRAPVVALVGAIIVVSGLELARAIRRLSRRPAGGVLAVFVGVAAAAFAFAVHATLATICYVYIVVAVFDGFSQTGGQLVGRRKLAPAMSPGKTIEGLASGLMGAVLTASWFGATVGLRPALGSVVGMLIAIVALVGDLAASWVKRRAGLKDYSALLPGQGGVLDRFDSFLAVAAGASLLMAWPGR